MRSYLFLISLLHYSYYFYLKLPLFQHIHRLEMGQVQLQGRDGNKTSLQCAKVCAGFIHASGGFAADPVLGLTARVIAHIERIAIDTQALSRDHVSIEFGFFQIRNIDVHHDAFGQGIGNDLFDDAPPNYGGS